MQKLKVSIITVCLNNARFLQSAIESVFNQDYQNIEYIIIDGGSTDGTVDIVKSYGIKISKFISEPDNGIYDAMNKGLNIATGEIIGILNSDDIYYNSHVISNVVGAFEKQNCDIVYGNICYVKQYDLNRVVRVWETSKYISGSFKKGWHPPHPALFVKNKIYHRFGLFNTNFKLAADFELMLRLFEKVNASSYYLPEKLVKMRMGGASTSLKNLFRQNKECYNAFKVNIIQISPYYFIQRLLPKFFQFLKL